MPRVAVAVRAGDVVLGSIWAAVPAPLSDDRMRALRDAARLVALHMLRIRAGEDVERRLRADLLEHRAGGRRRRPRRAEPARAGRPAGRACWRWRPAEPAGDSLDRRRRPVWPPSGSGSATRSPCT